MLASWLISYRGIMSIHRFSLLLVLISLSMMLRGQNVPISEFDETYESIGRLEVLSSPVSVKANGSIAIPFDETDSVYDIVVLDTLKNELLYNYYIVDSTYDALTNDAFIKVVYYEKQSFQNLVIGKSYQIASFNWKPIKCVAEGDTLYLLGCAYQFSKHYKRNCEDYSSGSKKQIENCIPVQYIYYEIVKIVELDESSIKRKN
jgi:hypothetical protein